MPDGTKPTEPKMPPLADKALLIINAQGCMTADQFDELSLGVSKALALADVLSQMEENAGADSLIEHSLGTTLCMLTEILIDVRGIIDASCDGRIACKTEAAERQAAQEVANV